MQQRIILTFFIPLCIALSVRPGACSDSLVTPKRSSGDRVVLTAKEIREMNVQSIPELLNRLPGITAGETYAKIQGATNVRVMLDGRPINSSSSGHGGIKWNMVSIRDIEKIVILMGGGAAAVGDGTSGGAILLTSKKNDGAHGHIDAAGGNYGTQDLTFRFGQQMSIVTMGASGSYECTDGYRTNNDKTKKRAGARVGLRDGDDRIAGISVDYASDDRGYPGKVEWPTPQARAFSENIDCALSGKAGKLNGSLYYTNNFKETDNPGAPLSTEFNGWSCGAKSAYTFSLGTAGPLTVGIEGQYDEAAGFRKTRGNASWKYNEEEWNAGAWTTKNFKIPLGVAPLSIMTGFRFNYYSVFSANVNPEVRIRFSPGRLSFNAGAAVMHNTPNLYKRYYESATTYCNPDLMPEQGINTAVGAGYSHRVGACDVSANSQFFCNFISDRITYISSSTSALGHYDNIGRVLRRGVDLSLGVKLDSLIPNCEPGFDYAVGFLDARDRDTDLYLTSSPKYNMKFTAAMKLFKVFTGRVTGVFTGEQYTTTDNEWTSDPHFLLDGSAELAIKKVIVYVRAENVFDTEYTYSDGYPGALRKYAAGVRCEF
jgi:vitamin B12 transporter